MPAPKLLFFFYFHFSCLIWHVIERYGRELSTVRRRASRSRYGWSRGTWNVETEGPKARHIGEHGTSPDPPEEIRPQRHITPLTRQRPLSPYASDVLHCGSRDAPHGFRRRRTIEDRASYGTVMFATLSTFEIASRRSTCLALRPELDTFSGPHTDGTSTEVHILREHVRRRGATLATTPQRGPCRRRAIGTCFRSNEELVCSAASPLDWITSMSNDISFSEGTILWPLPRARFAPSIEYDVSRNLYTIAFLLVPKARVRRTRRTPVAPRALATAAFLATRSRPWTCQENPTRWKGGRAEECWRGWRLGESVPARSPSSVAGSP